MSQREAYETHSQILCFTWGLSKADMQQCQHAFGRMEPNALPLKLVSLQPKMLLLVVRDVIRQMQVQPADDLPADLRPLRAVFVHTGDSAVVLKIIKSFKSVLPVPREVIFVMITETALDWTFRYYLDHVAEEHEYMKSHRPEDVPEMELLQEDTSHENPQR